MSKYTWEQIRALRAKIEQAVQHVPAENIDDDTALFFPLWEEGNFTVGTRCRRPDGKVYECIQAHDATGNPTWVPEDVPALWNVVHGITIGEGGEPIVDEWPEWVQPAEGHDAYHTGDQVTFNGVHYTSVIDNNVWSPTDYPAGWQQAE